MGLSNLVPNPFAFDRSKEQDDPRDLKPRLENDSLLLGRGEGEGGYEAPRGCESRISSIFMKITVLTVIKHMMIRLWKKFHRAIAQ